MCIGCREEEPDDKKPSLSDLRPEMKPIIAAVRAGGTAADMYSRLLKVMLDPPNDPATGILRVPLFWFPNIQNELADIERRITEAPDAGPPPPSAEVGFAEVVLARTFAKLRGGKWRDRLPTLYRATKSGVMPKVVQLLDEDEECNAVPDLWEAIKVMEGHPDLGRIWQDFALVFKKVAPSYRGPRPVDDIPLPPGVTSLRPFPGATSRPSEESIPPDVGYLNVEAIWRFVTREPDHLAGKAMFADAVPLGLLAGWQDMRPRVRKWILDTGVATATELLKAWQSGRALPLGLYAPLNEQLGRRLVKRVLLEFLKAGPRAELAPVVAEWFGAYARYRGITGKPRVGSIYPDGPPVTWGLTPLDTYFLEWRKAFPELFATAWKSAASTRPTQ